jgi:dienelactone hydrolase
MTRLVLAVLLLAFPMAARAQNFETVTFASADGTSISALFARPPGEAKVPAVVLLHGCGGRDRANGTLLPRHEEWAELLVSRGYAVLLPESFASRGKGSQCAVRARAILPWRERRDDAIGAGNLLRAQPFVDPARIALFGWSHGGSTVLASVDVGGFAAFVAFYPGCTRPGRQPAWVPPAPLMLLIGEADDWTPAHPCRALAAAGGPRVTYVEYPGAFHGFDAPGEPVRLRTGLAFSVRGDGTAHVGTDPAARADALRRVPEFLDGLLKGRGPQIARPAQPARPAEPSRAPDAAQAAEPN